MGLGEELDRLDEDRRKSEERAMLRAAAERSEIDAASEELAQLGRDVAAKLQSLGLKQRLELIPSRRWYSQYPLWKPGRKFWLLQYLAVSAEGQIYLTHHIYEGAGFWRGEDRKRIESDRKRAAHRQGCEPFNRSIDRPASVRPHDISELAPDDFHHVNGQLRFGRFSELPSVVLAKLIVEAAGRE